MLTQLHTKKVKSKHTRKNKTPNLDREKSLFENSAFGIPAHIKVAGGMHTQKRSFKRTEMMQMLEAARSR